jgi:hypothetical protein
MAHDHPIAFTTMDWKDAEIAADYLDENVSSVTSAEMAALIRVVDVLRAFAKGTFVIVEPTAIEIENDTLIELF